jgi:hypothetical protein
MLAGLDHIIIGVNDLAEAEVIFGQNLGLAVSGGGIHPTGGTANRVIVIGDTYIELITLYEPREAQQSLLDRLAMGDGYLNFALSSNDIADDSAAMKQRGAPVIGPTPGQLTSPDGRVRRWSRVDVERRDLTQRYPFIIQHDSAGKERRFRLAGYRQPPTHQLGAVKVVSATIAVADLVEAASRFQRIYGLQPSEPYSGEADGWEAAIVSFALGKSGQHVELASPLLIGDEADLETTVFPETGSLAYHLRSYGESLCRITLAVENMASAHQFLDQHGVTYTYQDTPYPVLWIHATHSCGAAITLHQL